MSILSALACAKPTASKYHSDVIKTKSAGDVEITFFKHASLSLCADGKQIYIDPVSIFADYASLPKADVILITHSHSDHLDTAAINMLSTSSTRIICDKTSAEMIQNRCAPVAPEQSIHISDNVDIETIAAYNTTESQLQFHPKEREDVGYILTIGGTRIYISGDSEPTAEMLALTNIDIVFLPVNQPYTMTEEQAIEVVKSIKPTIFYPYHYGQTEHKTDIDRLVKELEGITEVRIRSME